MTLRKPAARKRESLVAAFVMLATLCVVTTQSGCDPRQAAFFLQPFEPKIPAKCAALKGKRVVILTTSAGGLRTDYLNIDRDIAKKLGVILKENIKKIDVVDQNEVTAWVEGKPTWTDPTEAAKAFEADVVIFVELRDFQVQDPSSPGLFQGRANVGIQVIELTHPKDDHGKAMTEKPKESNTIYTTDISPTYPVTGHIPAEAGVNAAVFKNRFLDIVVKQISWSFVDHSDGDDIESQRFSER